MNCDCEQTVYADYGFYLTHFGGSLSAEEFSACAYRASAYLDYYTQGKAKKNAGIPALKLACCALAEQYKVIASLQKEAMQAATAASASEAAGIKSETVGAHTVSYQSTAEIASGATEAKRSAEQALAGIAMQYLAHTGLIYRGGNRQCSRRIL